MKLQLIDQFMHAHAPILVGVKLWDQENIIFLKIKSSSLIGLNDQLAVVKNQVLVIESLQSINNVYYLVAQEESNYISTHVFVVDEASIPTNAYEAKKLYGRGRGSSYGSSNKNISRYCTHCHKYGHTVEFYYQKHGHPQVNKFVNTCNTNASELNHLNPSPKMNQ